MNLISNARIQAILSDYLVEAPADSALVGGIQTYISVLLQWNQAISLTAVTGAEDIVRFHFGESFFAASTVPIRDGRLADVGSGAGFPGLPLKMLVPSLGVTLIESNAKKAAFLGEVIRRLAIRDAHVFRGRMMELDKSELGVSFDYVTARALGHFADLLAWARIHVAGSGKLVLWLGETDIGPISMTTGWNWSAPIQIPRSKGRFILAGARRD